MIKRQAVVATAAQIDAFDAGDLMIGEQSEIENYAVAEHIVAEAGDKPFVGSGAAHGVVTAGARVGDAAAEVTAAHHLARAADVTVRIGVAGIDQHDDEALVIDIARGAGRETVLFVARGCRT